MENPQISPDTYGQLIFDKGDKNIKWKKDSLFQKVVLGKLDNLMYSLTLCTKVKWLKDLNIRHCKTPRRKQRQIILWHQSYKCFLRSVSKVTEIKAKINQWDLIKVMRFCTAKVTIKKKRQPVEWGKIVSNDATDKGLISKIYKQLMQLNSKKKPQQLNWKLCKKTWIDFLQRRYTDGQ